jgi:hypothetical protein
MLGLLDIAVRAEAAVVQDTPVPVHCISANDSAHLARPLPRTAQAAGQIGAEATWSSSISSRPEVRSP